MLSAEDQALALELKGDYTFVNPNILGDFLREFQRFLEFTFEVEDLPLNERPRIELAHDLDDDEDTSKTRKYHPSLHIFLSKRKAVGENAPNEMFSGNLISGALRFPKEVIEDEVILKHYAFRTDNEFKLVLKTKTVKEQYNIIGVLERALNIHCRPIMKTFITLCGIDRIEAEEGFDKNGLQTINIYFQSRLIEEVKIDRSFILKYYQIAFGENVDFNSLEEPKDPPEFEVMPGNVIFK